MTLKLIILGTSAAVPSVERNLSSVGIRYDGNVYLFDCGEGTQRQMMKFGLSYAKVRAIFITHAHADHFIGIAGLIHTFDMIDRAEPLWIYVPKGTGENMKIFLRAVKARCGFKIEVGEVDEGWVYDGSNFTIKAFPTKHSTRNSFGYVFEEKPRRNFYEERCKKLGIKGRMFKELERRGELVVKGRRIRYEEVTYEKKGKKVVYTGDTVPVESTVKAAKGADVLIHEATYGKGMEGEASENMHSTSVQAAEIAKKAGVKMLILTHISGRYKDAGSVEEDAKEVFENTKVAYDGMTVLL